jgi:hypothetical protein
MFPVHRKGRAIGDYKALASTREATGSIAGMLATVVQNAGLWCNIPKLPMTTVALPRRCGEMFMSPETPALQCKLDWLSFTFPIPLLGEKDNEYSLGSVLLAFHDHTAHRFLGVVTNSLWQWSPAGGFYTHRIMCPTTGVSISFASSNRFALCELSGRTVDNVLRYLSIRELCLAANGRATRIDLAVDIETDCTPAEFSAERDSARFKSQGNYISETGETCYVGSRSSDRLARVYRYYAPHPRAHLLRAEAEYKGDAAKTLCDALIEKELTEVTFSAHLPFGWKHPLWTSQQLEVSKIPARAYDREGAGTLRWLELSVVPAIKKAAGNGLIDLKQWLLEHFPELST